MARLKQAAGYQEKKDFATAPGAALSAELMQKNALHTLGENAAAVLHELRSPLQTVVAHAQLLERKLKKMDADTEGLTHHFPPIYQSVEYINSMLTQFLRLSRLAPAQFKCMDLREAAQELIPLLRSMAIMRHIELLVDLPPVLAYCQGDDQQLKRLLFNLFANACDACAGREGAVVALRLNREDGHIVLSLSDNGCGIAPDKLEKIWQPFYTSKSAGTGLGLPGCLSIAEEHGGCLTVASELGQGTCFTLKLPEII